MKKAKTAGWLKVDLFLVFFCSKCLRDGQCHVNLTIFTLFLQSSSRKILQGVNNLAGHLVNYGKHRTRRSYARIKEVLDLPNLIEIQTNSYQWFLDEGLKEMFDDIMPIDDFQGKLSLEFVGYQLLEPKYTVEEARQHDANYSAPLHVTLRLTNHETGEIKSQDVFFGDFPLMTKQGTFIINGAERVIVSQLVRSPGVYFHSETDKNSRVTYGTTVIPNRGAWLEYETDAKTLRMSGLIARGRFL